MNQVYSRWLSRMISIFLLLTLLVHTQPAAAATITVGCGNTRVAELIAAIEQANSTPAADTIELAADCIYTLTTAHNTTEGPTGLPVISTPLTINGNGASIERSTAVDTPQFRLLIVKADLILHGLTLHNGATSSSDPEKKGGAIYNNGGTLTLIESTLRNNTAKNGGGIFNHAGEITIHHSTFSHNNAQALGGAIWSINPLTVTHSIFSANNAVQDGGAMYLSNGGNIDQSTFHSNTASVGGAISIAGDREPVFITNSTFSNNSAEAGGGIWNVAPLTIQHSTFSNNTAHVFGGAIDNYDVLTIQHSTISNNTAEEEGGGININYPGSLLLIDSTVNDNRATDGGGMYCLGDEFIIKDSTIRGNQATNQGGGIWNAALIEIQNSTISNNQAADGGGIWNVALIEMQNSTVSGNTATNQGGGIWNDTGLRVEASTITRNHAADGGGIWHRNEVILTQTIVAANTATETADIAFRGDSAITEEIISHGYNFIGSNATIEAVFPAGTPNSNGDYVGSAAAPLDPRLGPLANNGGSTLTHMPLVGSPVIDTGPITTTFTTDQRGFTRMYGPHVDIGAVEVSPSAFLHPTHVIEGSPAVFTVRLAMPLTQTVTIDYATSDGTAQAPDDYTATSGTVTFAPGTTEAVVLVPVPADAIAEASETFTLTLSSPSGVLLGTSSATATIVEAQARLYLSLVRTPAPTQQRTGQ